MPPRKKGILSKKLNQNPQDSQPSKFGIQHFFERHTQNSLSQKTKHFPSSRDSDPKTKQPGNEPKIPRKERGLNNSGSGSEKTKNELNLGVPEVLCLGENTPIDDRLPEENQYEVSPDICKSLSKKRFKISPGMECEELMAKGITGTGQGFDLPGRRLGGFSKYPTPPSLRQNAITAAENRAKNGALLPSGPRRIGGDSTIMSALSPLQAAAMAAERRLHDDLWCGQSSESGSISSEGSVQTSNKNTESVSGAASVDVSMMWQCSTCTLLNQPLALVCEACGNKNVANGAAIKTWSCKFCILNNSTKVDRCSAYGEWRYSYGPPTSSRSPYVGN